MTACFLDTTILVDVGQQTEPRNRAALKHTKANQPVLVADYAYRELLVGRIGLLCDAHNKVIAADNVIEVAIAFLVRGSFGRTPLAQAQEILRPLKEMFEKKAAISPIEARREVAEEIMMTATKLWRRATSFPLRQSTQALPCFTNGPITLDKNGLLRGPNDSFNCASGTTCGAAQWMHGDRPSLRKMIDALESPALPDALKKKAETNARRKALKLLELRGPTYITKSVCRKLGDAYFAAMCPPGAHVLTTNVADFAPLCVALKKDVKVPL